MVCVWIAVKVLEIEKNKFCVKKKKLSEVWEYNFSFYKGSMKLLVEKTWKKGCWYYYKEKTIRENVRHFTLGVVGFLHGRIVNGVK